ncbi:MAG: phosphoglucosamine mutase, partial [Candidatus Heimdallarchaeaceae archaeon]
MTEKIKLFGTAGIRGPYGKKVTAELVFDVCQAVASLYSPASVVIGHDARTSSEALSQCASAAISLAGGTVFNIGLCTFPVIANQTLKKEHPFAIYITASHNPPKDNGIKVFRDGREFDEQEQDQIEHLIYENRKKNVPIYHIQWDKIGKQRYLEDANDQYHKRILSEFVFQGSGRKLILDCANGPMSDLAPRILTDLDHKVETINAHIDGHFPGRLAEPSPKNLELLIDLCKKKKTLGAAFDGDGDRIAIIDENGDFVELSRINALLSVFALKEHGEGLIVVSIDSSTTIDRTAEKFGGKIVRTKLGELHGKIKELTEKGEKVIFAAEPWKPIFPNWGGWIDGLYGLLKLLEVINSRQTTVSEIIKEIPKHVAERKAYLVDEKEVE